MSLEKMDYTDLPDEVFHELELKVQKVLETLPFHFQDKQLNISLSFDVLKHCWIVMASIHLKKEHILDFFDRSRDEMRDAIKRRIERGLCSGTE